MKILHYGIILNITLTIALLSALYGLYKGRDVPQDGRTLEIVADIALNPVQSEYRTIVMDVSAFCAGSCCCGKWADGQTASGHKIQPGDKFVAAPPEYPFGTIMDVPGYGRVLVLDRGGAIKGDKLDCYFSSHDLALNFGRQQLKVKVWR